MRYETVCKLIAAATLCSVLVRWRAFSLITGSAFEHGGVGIAVSALTLAMLALALASVAGMWAFQTWDFTAFYPFGVLFTLVFGSSLIPFLPLLLPVEARIASVFVVNGIVLALVALVHSKHPGQWSECQLMAEGVEKVVRRRKAQNFLPTGWYCASSTRRDIDRRTQNPVLTARRAVEMASGDAPLLQNQVRRILASPNSRLLHQPWLHPDQIGGTRHFRFIPDSGHFACQFVGVDPHHTVLAAGSVLLRRKQCATVSAPSFCFMSAAPWNIAI